MNLEDARELVKRYGEKQAKRLFLKQRVKELEGEVLRVEVDLSVMETNVTAAAVVLDRHERTKVTGGTGE